MTAADMCLSKNGRYPKKRYTSEAAARRDLHRSHRFRHRRWPSLFHCECGGWHLTSGAS